jgi:hypothetical protein
MALKDSGLPSFGILTSLSPSHPTRFSDGAIALIYRTPLAGIRPPNPSPHLPVEGPASFVWIQHRWIETGPWRLANSSVTTTAPDARLAPRHCTRSRWLVHLLVISAVSLVRLSTRCAVACYQFIAQRLYQRMLLPIWCPLARWGVFSGDVGEVGREFGSFRIHSTALANLSAAPTVRAVHLEFEAGSSADPSLDGTSSAVRKSASLGIWSTIAR